MGWEDRQYYRDSGGGVKHPLAFLFFGSVPLFTVFGIRVRAHASLILFVAYFLVLGGLGKDSIPLSMRMESMAILFVIVLLHEFGHCFAGRWVGGDADEIMMTPIGGLALTRAPHRPLATFITVAGGPAVNVIICAVAVALLYAMNHNGPFYFNPIHYYVEHILKYHQEWNQFSSITFWFYSISLALLLFNLLPIFPLDGGQLLQSMLWPKLGYYRSMMVACVTGIVGGIILAVVGLSRGSLLLVGIAISGIWFCFSMRRSLRETGPESEYGNDPMDFSASLRPDAPAKKRKTRSRWAVRRIRRQAQRDAAEQQTIDTILAKVSAQGMNSLTWSERRALRKATERQRKHELEPTRGKGY